MPCPFPLVGRLQPDPGTRLHRGCCPLLLTAQPHPAPFLSPLLTGHPSQSLSLLFLVWLLSRPLWV